MRILIKQFLGKLHSWSVIGWGLADAWIKQGHEVHLFSTDGIEHLPEHLKKNLIGYVEENQTNVIGNKPDDNYDMQYSYTCIKNFPSMLTHSKNKFGQWCFEFTGDNVLPPGYAKCYRSCTKLLSPTEYVKEHMFKSSGIPSNVIEVIPHGINIDQYKKETTIKLPTKKKYKILANFAQLHLRKNINGLLDAYGKAFTKNDDVCLIIKAKDKKPTQQFEVSLSYLVEKFKTKYPNHAEIKFYNNFIEDMSDLYRSVDTVFSMAHGEGFNMPILEGLAAGKLVIAPNAGGHCDFANKDNALLIKSASGRADLKAMYWQGTPYAEWIVPDINDAATQLQIAYKNYEILNKKNEEKREEIYKKFSWETISQNIANLCQ